MNANVTTLNPIQFDRSVKTILVTGAVGDTGRPTVKLLLEHGHKVKALVRKDDERSRILRDQGADVIVGDMLDMNTMRKAADGVSSAYFVYPLWEGLVEASAIFAQVARERRLEMIVNMSHKQARPYARSKATAAHWLSEQIFNWSGVSVAHLRVTFFAEWLLYTAPLLKAGRYVTSFDPDSRFAPMAAADIARVVVGILGNPGPHIGQAYQLHGPVEYSHLELAATVGKVLGKPIAFEQVELIEFLKLIGLENDSAKKAHFEAVRIDQQEGLLRGTDDIGTRIIGRPLMTIEEFINQNRNSLS
ncbi:NmrA family NAD(P)-binding protein [Granulicella mallensis]|uniref:NmrA family protein n=1 Tax=Granulicella mallensis (strain ATCC BAA-1857 / DSM 23137 / MP5ACTX8) TaxID=682795 RepID=G8NQG5_GRAMM|nr:NmrA family NAD(P)-binding protein [Granulicella mallensis]AEU36114.1 NmrA family protein [Granulicella mallensis MP5ACTX8]